jgi:hypothetical protein
MVNTPGRWAEQELRCHGLPEMSGGQLCSPTLSQTTNTMAALRALRPADCASERLVGQKDVASDAVVGGGGKGAEIGGIAQEETERAKREKNTHELAKMDRRKEI